MREKLLPALDDDFALDAAGLDSLAELREDLRTKLLEADEQAVQREFREAVIDAAAQAATIDVPEPLVAARAKEAWEQRLHALTHRGISKDAYLQIIGSSEEQMLEGARQSAERALRAEAVIAAIVAEEKIEPSDDELLAALERSVEPDESGRLADPAKLLAQLRRSGRLDDLRADVAAEHAAAREKLWTPGS